MSSVCERHRATILALRERNLSMRVVAETIGCSWQTVRRYLQREGLPTALNRRIGFNLRGDVYATLAARAPKHGFATPDALARKIVQDWIAGVRNDTAETQ